MVHGERSGAKRLGPLKDTTFLPPVQPAPSLIDINLC